tara:strand:- start:1310 stop:1744 length:435 start_codon:yes stop_codon:yes gene_type:complete
MANFDATDMPYDMYSEGRNYGKERAYGRAMSNFLKQNEVRESPSMVDFMLSRGNPMFANLSDEDMPNIANYFSSFLPEEEYPGYYEGESVEPTGGLLAFGMNMPERRFNVPSVEDNMYEGGNYGTTGGSEYFNMGGNFEAPEGY